MRFFAFVLQVTANGKLNNCNPRETKTPHGSLASRAMAAHFNGLETLILFSAAVICSVLADCPRRKLEDMCNLYIMLRVIFSFYYVFFSGINEAFGMVRSAIFFMSQFVIYLMFMDSAKKKYGYIYLDKLN